MSAGPTARPQRISWQDEVLLVVEPLTDTAGYRSVQLPPGAPVRLSRFASLCRRGEELVLESPLAPHRVVLTGRAARELVTELAAATPVEAIAVRGIPPVVVREIAQRLLGLGFLVVGEDTEDEGALGDWEPHDLLLHTRSRLGRTGDPVGATFPSLGRTEPPAPFTPAAGTALPLSRPSWQDLVGGDPALCVAMEARRSDRQWGDDPVTLDQLSEFLYRVGRVRGWHDPRPEMPYARSNRPYPSGGAVYELELYLTVNRCSGLARGVHRYDPVGHRLVSVPAREADAETLLRHAASAAVVTSAPDVLITITSRRDRVAWKYQSIAYALTLKNVGALYQTMYLAATAMRLSACALGSGDSELAARAFGLDPLGEPAVGEFMIGSRPEEPPPDPGGPYWHDGNDFAWHVDASRIVSGGAG